MLSRNPLSLGRSFAIMNSSSDEEDVLESINRRMSLSVQDTEEDKTEKQSKKENHETEQQKEPKTAKFSIGMEDSTTDADKIEGDTTNESSDNGLLDEDLKKDTKKESNQRKMGSVNLTAPNISEIICHSESKETKQQKKSVSVSTQETNTMPIPKPELNTEKPDIFASSLPPSSLPKNKSHQMRFRSLSQIQETDILQVQNCLANNNKNNSLSAVNKRHSIDESQEEETENDNGLQLNSLNNNDSVDENIHEVADPHNLNPFNPHNNTRNRLSTQDSEASDYVASLKKRGSKLRLLTSEDPLYSFEADVGKVPEAPFRYRQIDLKRGIKQGTLDNLERFGYTVDYDKILGGGKWGRVIELKSERGFKLAAKKYRYSNKKKRKVSGYKSRMMSSAKRSAAGKQDYISEEECYNEIKIMNTLRHSNLVQLYDVVEEHNIGICLIMEHLAGGELLQRISSDDYEPTEMDILIYMKQICEAIKYIHSNQIIHLDLKPENIMCVDLWSNHIKIIDFGLARIYDPDKETQVMLGTAEFTAPEVLTYEPISYATDMWSIGVILYILFSGFSPFLGDTEEETVNNIMENDPEYPEDLFSCVSQDGLDFVQQLIVDEPEDRMSAKSCIRHPWMTDYAIDRMQKIKVKERMGKYLARPGQSDGW